MFDNALLDSRPARAPVLEMRHWLIVALVGLLGFLPGLRALPGLFGAAETKVFAAQSAVLGASLALYALMLCYVLAEARHLGYRAWRWYSVVLVLNVVGFLLYLLYSAAKTGDWKRATVPIAYVFEVVLVGGFVLTPIINTEALTRAQLSARLLELALPPPPPPLPIATRTPVKPTQRAPVDIMSVPPVIPKTITQFVDEPEPPRPPAVGVLESVPGSMTGGISGSIPEGVYDSLNRPPPPPQTKIIKPTRIHVGGQVEQAKLIFQPKPEYPPLAKMARIQGVVRLEAVISRDGTIQDLKVLQGHPLLVKAAIEAVARWHYMPTLLNGEPVEVVTEIDVNFTLAE